MSQVKHLAICDRGETGGVHTASKMAPARAGEGQRRLCYPGSPGTGLVEEILHSVGFYSGHIKLYFIYNEKTDGHMHIVRGQQGRSLA